MVNCRAEVFVDVDQLDHGHRAAEQPTVPPIWGPAPAKLDAPTRSWERQAAVEGAITGHLHVHTHVNLKSATRVVIAQHHLAGEYQVLAVAVTSSEWRLTLGRRPHHAP